MLRPPHLDMAFGTAVVFHSVAALFIRRAVPLLLRRLVTLPFSVPAVLAAVASLKLSHRVLHRPMARISQRLSVALALRAMVPELLCFVHLARSIQPVDAFVPLAAPVTLNPALRASLAAPINTRLDGRRNFTVSDG